MKNRILIIDDDPSFREMVSIALKQKLPDLEIDEVRDGHIGEKWLRETRYDLILLDYKLPFGMDGLRFLEKTEGLRFETPLIMITGEGNENVAAKAFRLGVTDYLVKTKTLLHTLQALVSEILAAEDAPEGETQPPQRKHANLTTASSGVEFVRNYQDEIPAEAKKPDQMGEAVMVEFDTVEEFNKFSSYVKRIDGVQIQDVRVVDNRFIFQLSLLPSRFEKMGKVFVTS